MANDTQTEKQQPGSLNPVGSAVEIHARARLIEKEIAQMTEAEKRLLGEQVADLMRFFNMPANNDYATDVRISD